jgi:sortase A
VRNIGVLLILFAAWQLWGTAIAQHSSQAKLGQEFHAKVRAHPGHVGLTLLPAAAQLPVPPEGSVMALIQIPKIGVNQYVVSGTDADDLAKGPGHYTGTALPGQHGNVAIAGHRTTHGAPFNRLAELAPGDPIYLTDLAGQKLRYVVAATPFAVSPSNVSVLNYFGDNRLTLTTCNPEFSASQRLIVVAGYVGPGATRSVHKLTTGIGGAPYKVAIGGEAGWNTGLIPLVLVLTVALVSLSLTNRRWSRILGSGSRWLILLPIWTALIFALFAALSNFLPTAA